MLLNLLPMKKIIQKGDKTMSWNWAHFKDHGWLDHTKQAGKLSGLLLLSGVAMLVHALLPFWQQPEWLQAKCVGAELCRCADCEDCECCG